MNNLNICLLLLFFTQCVTQHDIKNFNITIYSTIPSSLDVKTLNPTFLQLNKNETTNTSSLLDNNIFLLYFIFLIIFFMFGLIFLLAIIVKNINNKISVDYNLEEDYKNKSFYNPVKKIKVLNKIYEENESCSSESP